MSTARSTTSSASVLATQGFCLPDVACVTSRSTAAITSAILAFAVPRCASRAPEKGECVPTTSSTVWFGAEAMAIRLPLPPCGARGSARPSSALPPEADRRSASGLASAASRNTSRVPASRDIWRRITSSLIASKSSEASSSTAALTGRR